MDFLRPYPSHCHTRIHCRTCRAAVIGIVFRVSVSGLPAPALFDCPDGFPWDKEESFVMISNAILSAPDAGLWTLLKDELRVLRDLLKLHSTRPSCWKKRQIASFRMKYYTSRQKMSL